MANINTIILDKNKIDEIHYKTNAGQVVTANGSTVEEELSKIKNQVTENTPIVINNDTPIGAIIYMDRDSVIPDGWLKCDGRELPVSDYPDLFSILGYKHGGSGNTFKLPNILGNDIVINTDENDEITSNVIIGQIAIIKIKNFDTQSSKVDLGANIEQYSKYVQNGNWKNAFQQALLENDKIYVPKGRYPTSVIEVESNKTIYGAGDETVFVPLETVLFRIKGSVGESVNISNDIVDFSNNIELTDSSGFKKDDYIIVTGQRVCLDFADSGYTWCLGYATPGAQGLYFGEFAKIKNVQENTLNLYSNLMFPDYLDSKLSETNELARDCTTVQKVNFVENVTFKDFKVEGKCNPTFNFDYALNCKVENIKTEVSNYSDGMTGFITFKRSLDCTGLNNKYYRFDDTKPSQHHYINVYRITSSQNCTFDGNIAFNCTQPFDVSYATLSIPSINAVIKNNVITNATQTGITSHGGTYKLMVMNNNIYSSHQGINSRTKNSVITGNLISGMNESSTLAYGIALYEGHATDSIITNNNISNFGSGIAVIDGVDLGETFTNCNSIISENTINNCYWGVLTNRGSNADRKIPLNLKIAKNTIRVYKKNTSNTLGGVYLYNNTNGVDIHDNIIIFEKNNTLNRGVWCGYDCTDIYIKNNIIENVNTGIFFRGKKDETDKLKLYILRNILRNSINEISTGSNVDVIDLGNINQSYITLNSDFYNALSEIPNNTLFLNKVNRLCFKDNYGTIVALHIPQES